MSNKFVTALDKVGDALKWFFTNKTAEAIEQGGIAIAEVAFPGASLLLNGIAKSLATAQGLAATAPASGQTTAQITALAIQDAQAAFAEYEQTTGTTIETAQQQAIIAAFIALLNELPGATNIAPQTSGNIAPAPSVANAPSSVLG